MGENAPQVVGGQPFHLNPPEIDSPFTDIRSVSKNQHDAITQLYELGVASGISDTAFAPSALMTRAAMAGFMAAMLDHSNARPAGVSIQVDKTSAYGEYVATALISVRNDEFGTMADQLVDVFQNNCVDTCDEPAHFETSGDDIGKCNGKQSVGDCMWNTDDHQTDGDGNIFFGADIGATPEISPSGNDHTIYAWIGEDSGDEFNVDENDYVSVTATYMPAETTFAVSTSISDEAVANTTGRTDGGVQVDMGATKSVVVTAQLRSCVEDDMGTPGDTADDVTTCSDVEREGVEVTVGLTRTVYSRGDAEAGANPADTDDGGVPVYENTEEAVITTNADGTVTFTVDAPRNIKSNEYQDVVDVVTFTADDSEDDSDADTEDTTRFNWVEDDAVYDHTTSSATEYVLVDGDGDADDDGSINISVRLYDQYGNGIRQNAAGDAYVVTMTLLSASHMTDIDPDTTGIQEGDVVKTPTVSSSSSRRGMARALFAVNQIAENPAHVAGDLRDP